MSNSKLAAGLRHLRGKLASQQRNEESDEQLLHAFTAGHDDIAFAVLVRRHGPMVFRVCQRVLDHQQDAEDAFQATFLVLARKASALRKSTGLIGFLHGTAYRLAMHGKRSAARRRKHEGQASPRPSADPADELSWREVRALLDEEIAHLPDIYRSAFILCCLENVSREEAARRLGVKPGTLSSRLTEARKRLEQRLARRGVELTAVLGAAALATPPASAVSPMLMASTIKAALATAAGEGLAGLVSAPVAALVESSSSILDLGKAKLAMLILLAGSLLSGGGTAVHFQRAAIESAEPPTAEKAKPLRPAAPAAKEGKEIKVFAGRVLDPDGKPLAGAKLYLLYYTPKELPIPVRATSGKDGRFRFTTAKKDFDQSVSARPWDEAIVVAMADGYGVGVPVFLSEKPVMDWTLRLAKDDVPIAGRILDLQGKPVAGVTVSVHQLFNPIKEDLTDWLHDLKEKKEGYTSLRAHTTEWGGLWMGRDLGKVFPPAVTGADGRFCLRGVGRERVAAIRLQGASIAVAERFVMTRPSGTIRTAQWRRGELGEEMIFCGSAFEYIAAPCQPIIGVVRDKDTGKPLPGAIVRSYLFAGPRVPAAGQTYLHAVADKEGRYRLTGMPKGQGNEIRAEGPDGQPYLMSLARVPKGFALEPVTVDFQLKRGVWIEGTVTDKATGKPVNSWLHCAVFEDNPFRKEAAGLTFNNNQWSRHEDGFFRFVGLLGRSVVTAQGSPSRYLTNVGADRIKGLDRLHLITPYHTVVEINPAKDAKVVRCDIVLDPGRTRSGKILDPDGRPLAGVLVAGLSEAGDWEHESLPTAAFTVVALKPDETRLLQFSHADKHLASSLVVRGDAKRPLTVTLEPAATLTGRFVTRDGKKPLADVEMVARLYEPMASPGRWPKPDPAIGTFPRGLRTDKNGKFRIENLAPGLKYRLDLFKGIYVLTPDGRAGTGVTVKAGEMKDLGEVTVKTIE